MAARISGDLPWAVGQKSGTFAAGVLSFWANDGSTDSLVTLQPLGLQILMSAECSLILQGGQILMRCEPCPHAAKTATFYRQTRRT